METGKRNRWELTFFYLSIIIYPVNALMGSVLRFAGFGSLASKTIFICYAALFVFELLILFKFPISMKDTFVLLTIYLLYFVMYFLSQEEIRYKYTQVDMLMIYFFYLPYSVFILSRISDFSSLFSSGKIMRINEAIIISSFISKFFLKDPTGYMTFSYNLLPIWIMYSFSFLKKITFFKSVVFLVLFMESLLFGARGPIVCLFLGICGFILLTNRREHISVSNRRSKYISFAAKLMEILLMVFMIAGAFYLAIRFSDSQTYIVNRFLSGKLAQSDGRNFMKELSFMYLQEGDIHFNGLFYDRLIMPYDTYAHNLILEVLLSFGWLIGLLFLVSLAIFIISTLAGAEGNRKIVVVFLICTYFLKYFVSGSIFDDYFFIVFFSTMIAVRRQGSEKKYIFRYEVP